LQLSLSNSNFGNRNTMLDLQALHPHENEKRTWCNLNLTQWHKFVFKLSWSQHNLESTKSYSPNNKLHIHAFYIKMANSSDPLRILLQHGTTGVQYSQKTELPRNARHWVVWAKFLCTKFLVWDLPQSFMHMPIMTLTTLWAIW
jgi:hypothetical protein